MRKLKSGFFLSLLCLCYALSTLAANHEVSDRQGQVYFLRHAIAPGSGDPPGMRLDRPSSQRNLSTEGRAQAKAIGEELRASGVTEAIVYCSQWNRCLETAELLGFSEPIPHPGLNSFWQRRAERPQVLADFQKLINSLPEQGPPVILVTHYVNIQAVTGRPVASGKGFWVSLCELR